MLGIERACLLAGRAGAGRHPQPLYQDEGKRKRNKLDEHFSGLIAAGEYLLAAVKFVILLHFMSLVNIFPTTLTHPR